MRKLFWFCVGFCGTAFVITRWVWANALVPAAVLGGLFALAAVCSTGFRWMKYPAVVLLGALMGCCCLLFLQKTYYAPLYRLDQETISGEILVTDYPEDSHYGFQANASFNWMGNQYPVRVYLKSADRVEPGNILSGQFQIQLTIPQGSKASDSYPGKRILALVTPKGECSVSGGRADSFLFLPQRLAKQARDILCGSLPEDVAPFALSLLLGDSSGLDYVTKTALSVCGIRHIVAVSGLHVGVLCAAVWFLTGRQRILTALTGIPVLFLFAAMAGFSPSVCRAGLMAGLMMLAALFKREYDGLTGLAFSVLMLLLINPFVIQNAGFQLSVSSVLGILLFYPRLSASVLEKIGRARKKKFSARLFRFGAESVCITLSAMSLSTPIAVYYFGMVSLIAPIMNILCLWLVSISFYGIGITWLVGSVFLPAGCLAGGIAAIPMRLLLRLASMFSRFPLAALYTASPYTIYFLVVLYGLLLLWLVCGWGRFRYYATGIAAALIGCVILSSLGPRLDECRLTVLDVGQGQCLLLQSKGETMVVDCGGWSEEGAADAAAQMLLSSNIHTIRALALTHYDLDHIGGVEHLLTRVKADGLLLPGEAGNTVFPQLKTARTAVTEALSLPLGVGTVHCFPYCGGNSEYENSMAILFETENCGILITGDLDGAGERALLYSQELPMIDVLVVGHHGSKNSTSQELLEKTAPKAAVISVGEKNRYGHPAQQVLDRLEDAGCRVYRTDHQGTIIFRR